MMAAYEKPSLSIRDIEEVVRKHFEPGVSEIEPLSGGNVSSAFSFVFAGKGYVIKFSDLAGAYETDRYVSDLLSGRGIPFPACLALGRTGEPGLAYVIMERLEGRILSEWPAESQIRQLPELIGLLAKLAGADVRSTTGYGWIGPDGNGAYASWREYVAGVHAEDQTGTFWENWHELFRASCLERDVYEEIHSRLMAYVPYNEPHRSFVHGDFHQWNVLSDGSRITGVIDGNYLYGDCLVDLAVLDRHMPWGGVVDAYRDSMAKSDTVIPHFEERLKGAYYFKGLDGLRFYARMGWEDAYRETRAFLLGLESI